MVTSACCRAKWRKFFIEVSKRFLTFILFYKMKITSFNVFFKTFPQDVATISLRELTFD